MKATRILFATLMVLCWFGASLAQRHFTDLPRIGNEIEHRIHSVTPEWTCRPIQPTAVDGSVTNDSGVVMRQCSSRRRIVRVAVVNHQSEEQSTTALRQFASDKKTNDRLHGLGAEAYIWGIGGKIAFRLANLTVYVTAVVMEDPEAPETLRSPEARENGEQSAREEAAGITRGFATRVAVILQTF